MVCCICNGIYFKTVQNNCPSCFRSIFSSSAIFCSPTSNSFSIFFVDYSHPSFLFTAATGKRQNPEEAKTYIRRMYEQQAKSTVNRDEWKTLYPHFTCATDTNNIRRVFSDIRDTVLLKSLRDYGVIWTFTVWWKQQEWTLRKRVLFFVTTAPLRGHRHLTKECRNNNHPHFVQPAASDVVCCFPLHCKEVFGSCSD